MTRHNEHIELEQSLKQAMLSFTESMSILTNALRNESEKFSEHKKQVDKDLKRGGRITKHRINL